MKIYKYTPKKIIRNAAFLSGVCIFAAASLLIISFFIQSYRTIYQVSYTLLALAAIQLTARYVLSSYTFVLDDVNFIIIKVSGKRATQICNINLRESIEIIEVPKKKPFADVEKKHGKIAVRRNFSQNMMAEKEYACIFGYNGKTSAIVFDADIYFIGEMKRRAEEAKLRYGE